MLHFVFTLHDDHGQGDSSQILDPCLRAAWGFVTLKIRDSEIRDVVVTVGQLVDSTATV